MAYMNQEKKAVIKAALDKVLKPLGIKYSLRVDNHSSINCTIQAGPVDFIGNYCAKNYPSIQNTENNRAQLRAKQHMQVNLYWIRDHFSGPTADLLVLVAEALKAAGYYDRSDAMVDYFDTAYYMHLNIGQWDKPYKITAPTMRQAAAALSEEAIKAKILSHGCNSEFLNNRFIVKVIQ